MSASPSSIAAPLAAEPTWARIPRLAGLYLHAALVPVTIAGAQVAMGLLLVGAILSAIATGRRRLTADPLAPVLGIFVGVKILAAVLSDDVSRGLTAATGDWTLLFYLILRQSLRDAGEARRALAVFVGAIGVAGAYAVVQHFHGWDFVRSRALEPSGDRFLATGFFGHHLTYAGVELLGFGVALGAIFATSGRDRLRFGAVALLAALGLVVSYSRTGWMGMIAAFGVPVLLVGRQAILGIAGLGAAGALAVLLTPTLRARFASLADLGDLPRMRLWQTAVAIARDHPILGAGPGAWRDLFADYKVPGEYMNTGHPHNDVLNQLVQVGVVGLAAWLAIWVRLAALLLRARHAAGGTPARLGMLAGLTALVGWLVGGLGQCFFTDEEVAMALWLTVATTLTLVVPPGDAPRATPSSGGGGS